MQGHERSNFFDHQSFSSHADPEMPQNAFFFLSMLDLLHFGNIRVRFISLDVCLEDLIGKGDVTRTHV